MHELPTYLCRRINEPITIDGVLNEKVWARLSPVGDFQLSDGSGPPQLPTELKLCWDDAFLYLAFVAIDTDIWGTFNHRDDPLYEEEVVEAFICTGPDLTRYFEFQVSPRNILFDARIQCPESGDRTYLKVDLDWDCEGLLSAVKVVGTLDNRQDLDEKWTVELALPFQQISKDGRSPSLGDEWRANFYRIDRAEEGEFSCWSPTLAHPPNFHVPARFGRLVFAGDLA